MTGLRSMGWGSCPLEGLAGATGGSGTWGFAAPSGVSGSAVLAAPRSRTLTCCSCACAGFSATASARAKVGLRASVVPRATARSAPVRAAVRCHMLFSFLALKKMYRGEVMIGCARDAPT